MQRKKEKERIRLLIEYYDNIESQTKKKLIKDLEIANQRLQY